MKAKTLKRLAILIAVLSLVGGTGFFTQRIQVERMARNEVDKAELALKARDFTKAQTLFREHLQVLPNDLEIQLKYADALLKVSRSRVAQFEALQIYNNILNHAQGREDVLRLRMQLKIDMGQFVSHDGGDDGADVDLKILLGSSPDDGELLYYRGRCYEQAGDDDTTLKKAESNYREAMKSKAPQRIEAGERLATLLREKLKKPDEAKQVIDAVVKTSPNDYRAYLVRGRYHLALAVRDPSQTSHLSDAKKRL